MFHVSLASLRGQVNGLLYVHLQKCNYSLYCAVEQLSLPCITKTAGAYFLEVERKRYKSLNEAELEEHNLWHDRIIAGLGFSARDFNEYTF